MLSDRHYEHRARKYLEQRWLRIKDDKIRERYEEQALTIDTDGLLVLALFTLTNTLFNICLCLFLPQ